MRPEDGGEDGHLRRPQQELLRPDEGRAVGGEGGEAADVEVREGQAGHAQGQGGGQRGGQAVTQRPVHVLVARPHQRAVVTRTLGKEKKDRPIDSLLLTPSQP